MKGLRGNQTEKEVSQEESPTERPQQTLTSSRSASKKNPLSKNVSYENGLAVHGESEKALALIDETTNNTDVESLNKQVKSMMTFNDNANPYSTRDGRARICKVCGKEGRVGDIMDHIEVHHITGISIPCELCGKVSKSRGALRRHKSDYHRNKGIC